MINFNSIGFIKTDYISKVPEYAQEESGHYLEIKEKYLSGLLKLDQFKYIHVFYYLDRLAKTKEIDLQVKKGDQLCGVFATRSTKRPNPIALSTVEIKKIEANKIYISNIDAFDNTPIIDIKPYTKNIDMKNDANSVLLGENPIKDNKVHLYTDGACSGNPGPGGYAAIIEKDGIEYEISGYEPNTTNNRMELMAVIEGLKEIKAGSHVKLISDSNYVLKGLKEWVPGWKKRNWKTASNKAVKNKDLWLELDELIKNYKMEYIKVKGHSGHEYNERVDSLAREEITDNIR